MKKNIKLILAYHGGAFSGWQKNTQKEKISVEETLEIALEKITRQKVKLQAASRTDAGVHAEGQAVNLHLPQTVCLRQLMRSLNGVLPHELRVLSAEEMPEHFHPTLDCKKKEYWYQICNTPFQLPFHRKTSWHYPTPLDLSHMQKGAKALIGTHDFSAFCNERSLWDRNPVCTIESIIFTPLPENRLKIAITGDHFLYKMVRNLAGTLAYCGSGKLDPDTLPAILLSKERSQAAMTAPAHGLCLKTLFY